MGVANKNYFGEAIPFSRADIAGNFNFDSLCDCDLEKNVTKAKIWKIPAAQKFIDDNCGGSVALAFWKKSMRDAVSPKPNLWGFSKARDRQSYETYAREVSYFGDLVMNAPAVGIFVVDGEEKKAEDVILSRYYLTGGNLYSLGLIGRTIFSDHDAYRISKWDYETASRKAKMKNYGKSKDEKAIKKALENIQAAEFSGLVNPKTTQGLESWWVVRGSRKARYLEVSPKGSRYRFELPETILPEISRFDNCKFFVLDASNVGKPVFHFVNTREEADNLRSELAAKHAQEKKSGTANTGKKRFSYILDHVEQTGPYADNGIWIREIAPDDLMGEFHFRGGEFGNWMSEKDMQGSMNASYTSFENLALLLGIKPSSVSFGGKMGIAYGSRGHGKAAAHYEHGSTDVINLTKMSGAGCLAHEWGHALDRHIADALGMTEGTLASTKSFRLDLPKELTDVYDLFSVGTRYRRDSIKYGSEYQKAGGYWDSNEEMFARAFDCYILDKLRKAGIKDTYLSAYAEKYMATDSFGSKVFAYPVGEERKEFEKAFDALIKWAKNHGVLESADKN